MSFFGYHKGIMKIRMEFSGRLSSVVSYAVPFLSLYVLPTRVYTLRKLMGTGTRSCSTIHNYV